MIQICDLGMGGDFDSAGSVMPLWDTALRAKYQGKSQLWGRQQFDAVFKGYDVTLDTPVCFFAEDLIEAYPDAKVILNYRDPDAWLASMNKSIFAIFSWPSWRLLRYTDPSLCGAWRTHTELQWDIFCGNYHGERCRQAFIKHYESIRRVVPKHRLLEWKAGDGWQPLCDFLKPGMEVPDVAFPHINDNQGLREGHLRLRRIAIRHSIVNLTALGLMVLLCTVAGRHVWRS